MPYHPYWGYLELTRRGVELDIPKIVGELRKMDMGLCLYLHGQVIENTDLDRLFATYEKWGVAGLKKGTKAHEVALFLCYPGPAAVMRGDVRKLLETDASVVEFLKALPWNYDDTRVLDAAIARHLVVSRRRGENWYLAGMTGEKEYMTEFLFDFLPDGREFTLRLWRDDFASESRPRGYVCETRCVRKGDSLAVPMARCGGFLALIERP